jgi:membrane dipeptidase
MRYVTSGCLVNHLLKPTLLLASAAFNVALLLGPGRELRAETLPSHTAALVLDGHADVLLPTTPARYALPGRQSRVDLPRLTAGGVDAVVLSVAVGPGPRDAAGVAAASNEAQAKLATIKAFVSENPGRVGLALTPAKVEQLHRDGQVAVIIGFQNARSLGRDISRIDGLYASGVRVFALTHQEHNDFADSSRPGSAPPSEHGGLSELGRRAVAKLNDLGVLIDVSQLSTDALLQTVKLSRAPVAATHSDVRRIVESVRNLSDVELDAVKASGGIVQLTPFSPYVHTPTEAERGRAGEARVRFGLPAKFTSFATEGTDDLPQEVREAAIDGLFPFQPVGTLAEFVDHIDYVVKRIGIEHVGIGTDFNHGAGVTGFLSAADAPNVTSALAARGYTPDQINAIWGGNFLRVWRATEAAARK